MVNDFKNSPSFSAPRAGFLALLCMILSTLTNATCPTANEDYMALFGQSGSDYPTPPVVAFRTSTTDAANGEPDMLIA